MTKKEYKALQERYYKATCILLDIEKMKENILKLEDDKLFEAEFSVLAELYRKSGVPEDKIETSKKKMRDRALRLSRATLLRKKNEFKLL